MGATHRARPRVFGGEKDDVHGHEAIMARTCMLGRTSVIP
jgi:hypothetical protein